MDISCSAPHSSGGSIYNEETTTAVFRKNHALIISDRYLVTSISSICASIRGVCFARRSCQRFGRSESLLTIGAVKNRHGPGGTGPSTEGNKRLCANSGGGAFHRDRLPKRVFSMLDVVTTCSRPRRARRLSLETKRGAEEQRSPALRSGRTLLHLGRLGLDESVTTPREDWGRGEC